MAEVKEKSGKGMGGYWDVQKRLDRQDAKLKEFGEKVDWIWMCLRQANVPWSEYVNHPMSPWNKK